MASGTVYLITNERTGKGYVGSTTRPLQQRYADHLDAAFNLRRSNRFCMALRRHGAESFTMRALKKNVPLHRLASEENRYMGKHGTLHPHGYNMVPARDRLASTCRKSYYVERTITVRESVTYYRKGKPALRLTRVYRETRRGRRLGLPGSSRRRLQK